MRAHSSCPANGRPYLAGASLLLTLVLAACGGGPDSEAPTSGGASSQAQPSVLGSTLVTPSVQDDLTARAKALAAEVIVATNAARAVPRTCGDQGRFAAAGPVSAAPLLEQAALAQVVYLRQTNTFGHEGANGSTVGERVTATGYKWSTVGENLAAGYIDVKAVVEGWINSPGHCVNLMGPNFTEIGVVVIPGYSTNTYRSYWGMVLGRPR